jgi:hypothetical protein
MELIDTHINKEKRYSLGRETESGRFYLSIPVSNPYADYEEYYEISEETHNGYPNNSEALDVFAEKCRARLCDHLLMQKPGKYRGVG